LATSSLTKLGLYTNGAGVQVGGKGKLGDAASILVEIGDATRMGMGQALMPKDTLLITSEMLDDIFFIRRSKHQVSKRRRRSIGRSRGLHRRRRRRRRIDTMTADSRRAR
jgi:hypothetical protein